MSILYDVDMINDFVERQNAQVEALKLAMIANDTKRLPALFPAYAPSQKVDNDAAIAALDKGAPVEIRTDIEPEQAWQLMSMIGGSLGLEDISPADLPSWGDD